MQGTIRERDKVIRRMKGEKTAKVLMGGLKNYYNFLRPHVGLEKEPPAKRAKLEL
jgi:hypothetical protein